MLPADESFTAYLYRPYLDLGPVVDGGPLQPWGIEFAYRSLAEERPYPWMYMEHPPSFRERLLQVTGMTAYHVRDPRELAPELRTPRWQRVCDELDHYDARPLVVQWRVVRLLSKLGLYRAVLDRIPVQSGEEIARVELSAEMAYLRALARFVVSHDGDGEFDLTEFELVATHAPHGSLARIHALNLMIVQNVKRANDVAAVAHWLPLHREEIERARPVLGDAVYTQQMSRHHRAAGFLPQMRGDRAGVVREMDQCQEYAERMPRVTSEQRIVADELLFAALESRTKEALWLGDLDLAEARARKLVDLSPLDPLARSHLGQVLVEQERIEEALDVYLKAARIAAPESEESWFMAGQCYEALEMPERACDAYLAALRFDPFGISAVERLADVADSIGNPILALWSRTRLGALGAGQTSPEDRRELAPYQEYVGQLGLPESKVSGHCAR